MPLTAVTLEFSEDDLSDTTPTWTNVTTDCMGIEWWAGIDREGNDPQPGGATIQMRSDRTNGRRWEPDYVAGAFYPNVAYGRRFRLTLDDAVGSPVQEGLWYITDINPDYPMGTNYSVVTLTCADGFEVLALDDLPTLDPPSAGSYDDVVSGDGPWGFWGLGDPEGIRARANVIVVRREATVTPSFTGYRKFKGRRGTLYSTKSEAAATSGPSGIYKNTPTLGVPGLILGSSDTAVTFDGTQSVKIPLEDEFDQFGGLKALTLEAWVVWNGTPPANDEQIIAGPENASDLSTFRLAVENSPDIEFRVRGPNGVAFDAFSGGLVQGTTYHVVGVYGNGRMQVYTNGDLEWDVGDAPSSIQAGVTGEFVSIARTQTASGGAPNALTIMKAAIYTKALSADRILAHYNAGALRGYAQETAGNRIADIATHALWSEASIQTTGRDVVPVTQTGQARLEEIAETAHAEGVRTQFFFNGSGDPVYLGHEWQASSSSYNTTQATLGDQLSEVRYSGFDPRYDNETFNEVTASRIGADLYTAGDGTPPPRRVHTEFTDVLLANQNELESLAEVTLDFYENPELRPVSVTLNSNDPTRLNHMLRRDIGHLVRVKKSGDGGTQRIDRVANIIGKRKSLTPALGDFTCTWTLGRGFNAVANGGTSGYWQAGVVGFTEAGQTTVAA